MAKTQEPTLKAFPIDFNWPTLDPFLFCVHHRDHYPPGDEDLGPRTSLAGRTLGQDFTMQDGFRMYHGQKVPGFPAHPHRGFETITIVLKGFVDHCDSQGAAGRYGSGDVQWMTAGAGVQHSEMFPLVEQATSNPLELFQIWLNLPPEAKLTTPQFSMLWAENIPEVYTRDQLAKVRIVQGSFAGITGPRPPQNSWAFAPEHDIAIWLIKLKAGGTLSLAACHNPLTRRQLYFYEGTRVDIGSVPLEEGHGIETPGSREVPIKAEAPAKLLLLQGLPIGAPVAQWGPFVMNHQRELQQAMMDFHKTAFGGWPWDRFDPTHGPLKRRFAKYPDGKVEIP